jgi:hypothetical protein
MLASSREEIVEGFDALHAAVSRVNGLSFDVLTTLERLALLERHEAATRKLPVARHELINGVYRQATPSEIGGKLSHVLADRLRITRGKALTGGGSLLPMQDVIRPARHAPSLSGDLRQGGRDWALSHDTVGFAGAANRVVCEGPWAFAPGLQRVRVLL